MEFKYVAEKEALLKKNIHVYKEGKKQIALFSVDENIYAIDNRCPHEGYPLSQGSIDKENCTLTCNWHNWKFSLNSGECKLGADNVRNYPIKITDNKVYVDISEPNKDDITRKILAAIEIGIVKKQYGRIARELSRLHFNGIDPTLAIKKAIELSYDKFEYGMTHAYAVCADWLNLYYSSDDLTEKIICLTEAIEHISDDSFKQVVYPFEFEPRDYSKKAFLDAIEYENELEAVSLIKSAFSEKVSLHEIEKTITESALNHYNDFGHSLIYVNKVFEIISYLGNDIAEILVLTLVRSLCYSTREDLLPEFKKYSEYLNNELNNKSNYEVDFFQKSVNSSMDLVNQSNLSKDKLYDQLLLANAKNLLFYDINYQYATDNNINDNVGWLSFTHAITFSNAVRLQSEKYPDSFRSGLIQMACFNGRNSSYLNIEQSIEKWFVKDENIFWKNTFDKLLDHGLSKPIFSSHLVKTTLAVKSEIVSCSFETKKYLLAALNRFLNSPIKAKHVKRTINQAIDLVKKDFY